MTPHLLLRTVRPEDLGDLSGIEDACFGPESRFPPSAIADLIASSGISGIVAERGGRIVGFAFQLIPGPDRSAVILTVDVHPNERRSGIGRALVRNTLEVAKGLGARRAILQVGVGNDGAVALYSSLGFKKSGVLKDFYGAGRDAWEMELKL